MHWFTSDTHFGHANIIEHSNRPFSSIEEQDEELIKRWNECVEPGDLIYHLGDFSWHHKELDVEALLARLNGNKFLITGNHDQTNKHVLKSKQWAQVTPYKELTVGGQKIVLFHYRMVVWNASHHGSWALHGHSHGTLPVNLFAKTFDVGVDCWDYRPISFVEVAEEMQKHRWMPVDGHKGEL